MTAAPPRTPSLRRDQRGTIMLVGIVMGAVLVSALLFLLELGTTLVAQERLQDAADASAFQTAVWHARGMNVLALMNMLMAAILVIVVAIRLVELIVIVILLVCHLVTAPTVVGEAICGAVDAGTLTALIQLENRVAVPVLKTLKYISYAEAGLAVAMPYVATGHGLSRTKGFYREQGVAEEVDVYSLSQLPTHLDLALSVAGAPVHPRMGSLAAPIGLVGPIRSLVQNGPSTGTLSAFLTEGIPSLPVEGDEFEQLCSRTGELMATSWQAQQIPHLALQLIGPHVLPDEVMNTLRQTDQLFRMGVGDVFGSVSILLCEPIMSMVNRAIQSITHLPNFATRFALNRNGTTRSLLERIRNSPLGHGFLGPSVHGVHPAKLWRIAPNGSVFLRTWASAGNPAAADRFSFFTDIETHPHRAVASAEYYASCYRIFDGWSDDGVAGAIRNTIVRNCADDAMWRIGWSARMRRVRPVLQELQVQQIASGLIAQAISDRLPSFVANAPPVAGAIDWVFGNAGSPVTRALETVLGPIDHREHDARSAIIH